MELGGTVTVVLDNVLTDDQTTFKLGEDTTVTRNQGFTLGGLDLDNSTFTLGSATTDLTIGIAETASSPGPAYISSVAITSATGIQNDLLNAGDVVSVTATFIETVIVIGSPMLTLAVGSDNRMATYASGSGSAQLVFQYTIQAGEIDSDGISIGANTLSLNGGTISDQDGLYAILAYSAVSANTSYMVDGTTYDTSSASSENETDSGSPPGIFATELADLTIVGELAELTAGTTISSTGGTLTFGEGLSISGATVNLQNSTLALGNSFSNTGGSLTLSGTDLELLSNLSLGSDAAFTVDELRLEDKTLNLQSVSSFTVADLLVLDNTNEQITWDNTSLALNGGLKLDTNGELTWKNPGNLTIGNITLNGGVFKIGETTVSQTFVLDNSTNLTLTGRFRDLFQRWKYP